jgi:RNA polymerase sigma-70 factor (ECF subfamily)
MGVLAGVSVKPASDAAQHRAELDEVTLARAQRGDEAACKELVRCYKGGVFGLLSRMLARAEQRALVEDLAQETFLRVFRGLRRFSPAGPAPLSSWILTIASHLAIDELRRQRPEQPGPGDHAVADVPGGAHADEHRHRRELARAIQQAIADLPPEFRAAFLLREYHGLEYQEIARALRIDLGTVKSRLHRARAVLRTALAELADD